MVTFEDFKGRIRLHGLGFIQIHLAGKRRLHVWHPDLPRRACYDHSKVHNHRWGLAVQVLVGDQLNVRCNVVKEDSHMIAKHGTEFFDFTMYHHEGPRNDHGSRPWLPDGRCHIIESAVETIKAGDTYGLEPLAYHYTPLHDAPVVTLMTKGKELNTGAHSTCRTGVYPEVNFDSKQVPIARLWDIVRDALRFGQ